MKAVTALSPSVVPEGARLPNITREGGAVSWGAVFAGAVGAAAFSLVLILLGTGLGLSVVSPWAHDGLSAATAGISTIVWVTVVQILASVLGGYLAGRLRSRWITVHTHEVYFRDTAHGFLAWSVATLVMATLLSSAVGSILTTGAKSSAAVAGTVVAASDPGESIGYSVDSLFRPSSTSAATTNANAAQALPPEKITEVIRIFAKGLRSGELGAADTQYLGQIVATNTGLSQADAEDRVTVTFTRLKETLQQAGDKARQAADDARKASAYLALWLVISLLIGAFIASLAATYGGRLRDSSVLPNP